MKFSDKHFERLITDLKISQLSFDPKQNNSKTLEVALCHKLQTISLNHVKNLKYHQ